MNSAPLQSPVRATRALFVAAVLASAALGGCAMPGPSAAGGAAPAGAADAAENYRRGAALLAGSTGPRDPAEGARLIRLAGDQGDGEAAFVLATTPGLRPANERDDAGAAVWLRRAAIAGHPAGQYLYADALLNGRGVAPEPSWAALWMARSAANGYGRAQVMLGLLYVDGTALPADKVQAQRWFIAAQRSNTPNAARYARALDARMTPAERGAARNAAAMQGGADSFPDEALVRYVQYALGRLGSDPGAVDGIAASPATREAISRFERTNAMPVSGRIDTDLVLRLRERMRALG
ncbi:MAG: SEL1-like repeat protein [Phreatobacter sp.]|uniref:SEL1-like repeat protein n=1 Tax=Phreatobacter sp. TaxID=1966341 RepID=UPI001A5D44D7|nr:SEL1-like repeat protein [Phreatobacter sp.]MBL8570987.1 SEL1-like repeat protein [Phreatobacter sp.]